MNKMKHVNSWISFGKWIAAGLLIMGIIHDIATFTPLIQEILVGLSLEKSDVVICFSLGTGTSLILCGLLIFFLLNRFERYRFLITPLMTISIFLLIFGILSLYYMIHNPFAWVVSVLCFLMFGITLKLRAIID
ncbi:hypothetical protein [Dysgonomonas sp. 520]|uniref:hypothetical protein n=1 Tax=Dysgonomonas sp. 520 TaxID=2302931 RepID=UPI0013D7B688|nr:hypothetical protein [Dysgonomonas sp. 520]